MAGSTSPVGRPLRVAYISNVRLNPYVSLLAQGVHAADPAIQTHLLPSLSWLSLLDWRTDLLHLHWVELQYRSDTAAGASRKLKALLRKLSWAQRRHLRIIYTVHNLSQHEGRAPDLNEKANRWLFRHADALHVHDGQTARQLAPHCREAGQVYVVPHGNYIGVYANDISREEARRRLDIPAEHFVYLFLGQIRPYKGIDDLIAAFVRQEPAPATLVLAGHIGSPEYGERVRALVADHPHIRFHPHYIAGDDLQVYFNAADICVYPYRHATTSGAALLAFSFAKPIMAPALGPFPELVGGKRGLLFPPDLDGLTTALRRAAALDLTTMSVEALQYAAALDWKTVGAQHAATYRSLV